MARLDGKVAIITGGAKGFGLSTAQLFVQEGAKVVITDLDEQGGQLAIDTIGRDNAVFVTQDVAKENSWGPVFSTARNQFGEADILVNNAGILFFDDAEHIEMDEWHKILSVDLDGVMLGVKYAIACMKEHGGSIINMCSIAGLIGIANLYAYNAAKGAVRLLTKSAALYCAQQGYPIRINSIHPGYAHTPWLTPIRRCATTSKSCTPWVAWVQPGKSPTWPSIWPVMSPPSLPDPNSSLMAATQHNDTDTRLQI